jgi:hypothetical protein
LSDLVRCKNVVELFQNDESAFKFILKNWVQIEDIVKILKVFYDVTVKLQTANYTLTDFYRDWLLMELMLRKYGEEGSPACDRLCKALLQSLQNRKADLITNRAMLCCIFLDPRFKHKLQVDETALVKLLVCDMWEEIRKMNQATDTSNGENTNSDYDLLENFLAITDDSCISSPPERSNENERVDYNKSKNGFLNVIEKYESSVTRLHHKESVLQFWEKNKSTLPELYEVASVYFSIPPTQATVERTFSVLGFIFNNRRYNLSEGMLEHIMKIKMNKDLAQVVFEEELNEI